MVLVEAVSLVFRREVFWTSVKLYLEFVDGVSALATCISGSDAASSFSAALLLSFNFIFHTVKFKLGSSWELILASLVEYSLSRIPTSFASSSPSTKTLTLLSLFGTSIGPLISSDDNSRKIPTPSEIKFLCKRMEFFSVVGEVVVWLSSL